MDINSSFQNLTNMNFLTFGSKGNKSVLFIHGMASSAKLCYEPLLTYLKDYYVILTEVDGHVGTAEISGDPRFHDIYYDGDSHYYIDGTVMDSGIIPVLLVDTDENKYYQVTEGGNNLISPYYEWVQCYKCTAELGDTGRILLRASGTEPVLRVMAEAASEEVAEDNVDAIIAAMASEGHLIEVRRK